MLEEEQPGYEGEDEKGRFRIDENGFKKRPFEKGGPSPNPAGNTSRKKKDKAEDILDYYNWMGPLEFYLAVLNCDSRVLNKTRKNHDIQIDLKDITFKDQMEAAAKALPYYATKSQKTAAPKEKEEDGPLEAQFILPDDDD